MTIGKFEKMSDAHREGTRKLRLLFGVITFGRRGGGEHEKDGYIRNPGSLMDEYRSSSSDPF
jgi:hypothetical protein